LSIRRRAKLRILCVLLLIVTVIPPTQEDAELSSRKNTVREEYSSKSQLALLLFTKFIISHSSQQVR